MNSGEPLLEERLHALGEVLALRGRLLQRAPRARAAPRATRCRRARRAASSSPPPASAAPRTTRRAPPRASPKRSWGTTSETSPQSSASSALRRRFDTIHSKARAYPSRRWMNHVPPASGTSPIPMNPGTKRAPIGRDPHVARARERQAGAGHRAVDRRDHGLLERADRADVRVVRLLERLANAARELAGTP